MRQKYKRQIAFFLALLISLLSSIGNIIWAEEQEEQGFRYTISDGEAAIVKYIGEEQNIVIPETLGGVPVTEVVALNNSNIISIQIPACIKQLNFNVLYFQDNLEMYIVDEQNSVYSSIDGVLLNKEQTELIRCPSGKKGIYTVPDSVVTIQAEAFSSCKYLTEIILPKRLQLLGGGAFVNCKSLERIEIPSGVTEIYDYTFFECTNLKDVTWPENLESIGYEAFRGCSSLKKIVLFEKVKEIEYRAFWDCPGLEEIVVSQENTNFCTIDGVLMNEDGTKLLRYPAKKSGDYVMPDTVTELEDHAFEFCGDLQSITFSSNLTTLGEYAFYECDALQSVTIPEGVTKIATGAFYNCSNLKSVFLPQFLEVIGSSGFRNCDSLERILIPKTVTEIGSSAFSGCDSLAAVQIPTSVETIEEWAFSSCTMLQAITVDENNQHYASVDGVLFTKGMTQLLQCPGGKEGEYTVPDGVISIESNAFAGCNALTMITLSDSVYEIKGGFGAALTSFSVADGNPHYSSVDGALLNYEKSVLIRVPAGKKGSYVIPNTVITIDYAAFDGAALDTLTLPKSVQKIESYAFGEIFCSITKVIYAGTEQEWERIEIGEGNQGLLQAERQYGLQSTTQDCVVEDEIKKPTKIEDPYLIWKIGGLVFVGLWVILVVIFFVLRKRKIDRTP